MMLLIQRQKLGVEAWEWCYWFRIQSTILASQFHTSIDTEVLLTENVLLPVSAYHNATILRCNTTTYGQCTIKKLCKISSATSVAGLKTMRRVRWAWGRGTRALCQWTSHKGDSQTCSLRGVSIHFSTDGWPSCAHTHTHTCRYT